jgi:dihydroorotase
VTLQNQPDGLDALDKAVSAARAADVPMMVHSVHPPVPLPEILGRMERGDVLTHAYNGRLDGILDESDKIRPVVRHAFERGVIMDAGYGGGRFCSLKTARIAVEEGLSPHTLGTDAVNHATAPNPYFYSVSELVGLFHALGMNLSSAVAAATSNPAAVIGFSDTFGSLAVGTSADIAVCDLVEEETVWHGEGGQIVHGDRRLQPVETLVGGVPVWPGER